jgi:AraC family transcriptional regulator of adaptative response / DNA-3-methyladenine glycosylase II
VRAIVGQRVSVAAGRAVLSRLIERAGERCGVDSAGLDRLFPTAAAVATADLEGLGLPEARATALRDFASAMHERAIPFDSSSSALSQVLLQLRGVGAWTAGYIALRGLGDPDAFPSGDLVLRQQAAPGAAALDKKALEERAEMWRPFRGYAVFHLWRAATET